MPAQAPLTEPVAFRYAKPEVIKDKTIVRLCRSDIVSASVQVISHGGENNLHAHTAQDGVWMVLKGHATFYGEGDVIVAELHANDGVLIPRGFKYWFESSSPEVLEILHLASTDKTVSNQRIDLTPRVAGRAANSPDNLDEYTNTLKR